MRLTSRYAGRFQPRRQTGNSPTEAAGQRELHRRILAAGAEVATCSCYLLGCPPGELTAS